MFVKFELRSFYAIARVKYTCADFVNGENDP